MAFNENEQQEDDSCEASNQTYSNNLALRIPNQKFFRQPTFSTGAQTFINKQPLTINEHT
jgi:hypothetical protein